jgi:lipopolysaccharide transport system permease protein
VQYKGLFLGMLWSLFHPLLLMCIYYFVFGLIFQPRWPEAESDRAIFALILFLGIIVYNVCAAALTKGPGLVTDKAVFVKKVIFPLEVLSWANLGATFFFFMETFVLWAIMAAIFGLLKPAGLYFIFPLMLCMMGYYLGLTWFLSALGAFARDIGQIMQPVSMLMLFLTPIFYPLSVVPEGLRFIYWFNPLAFMVESARNVMLFGHVPQWGLYCLYTGFGWMLALLGFMFFRRCKRTFADFM